MAIQDHVERTFSYDIGPGDDGQDPPACIACHDIEFVANIKDPKACFVSQEGGVVVNIHRLCLALFFKFKERGWIFTLNANGDTVKEARNFKGKPINLTSHTYYDCTLQVFSGKQDALQNVASFLQKNCGEKKANFGRIITQSFPMYPEPFSSLSDYEQRFANAAQAHAAGN